MPALRTIEKKIRRLVLRLLAGGNATSPEDPVLEGLPERPRILLVRIDRIGDGIVSTPLIHALNKRFPHGITDILLGEKNRVLAPLLPDIRQSHVLKRKIGAIINVVRELRRNRYDVVVNLHLNKSASASLFSRLARGTQLIEYSGETLFGSDGHLVTRHVVQMTLDLVRPLGIVSDQTAEQHRLDLILPEKARTLAEETESGMFSKDSRGRRVFINISASHPSRNWPDSRFAELAQGLHMNNMLPVLCGVPDDAPRLRAIAENSGNVAVLLPSVPGYADFAGLLHMADIVITPDTSTVHLAAALGKPTVALYASEATAEVWGPWGVPYRALSAPGGIRTIEPDDVIAATLELHTSRREAQTGISDRSL